MLQKFCNLSCTVCCRNSATTSPLDVAEILLPLTHWVLQKFCDHSFTRYRKMSQNVTECHWMSLNVTECHRILQNVTECHTVAFTVSQKFYNHSYNGCRKNSVTTRTLGVAEILQPLIHWVSQKFCNHSFTRCCRNSATTHTLGVAEIMHPLIH